MSWNPALEPHCPTGPEIDAIETVIVPRARDLGGFEVRRALPLPKRQMVGPFIFFDQMGPAEFLTDQGIDVRPHPHIGLATVTYLYSGSILHRDSLGTKKEIHPGDVNWMIAGRGISHSERTSPEVRARAKSSLFGIQTWVALPDAAEETQPGFEHRPAAELPLIEGEGKQVRLILGSAYGERAPVQTFSEMFYADAVLDAGARLPLPDNHEDRGLYVLEGEISVAGQTFDAGKMMVFRPGDAITVTALTPARLMLLGGETLGGPRYIWWNFVASSKEKIDAAKGGMATGRLGARPLSASAGRQCRIHPRAGLIGKTIMSDVAITREVGTTKGRYVARVAGIEAEGELTYSRANAHLIIADHTEVPEALRSRRIGLALATRLVEDARAEAVKIIPLCPYVNAERRKHPDWNDVFEG